MSWVRIDDQFSDHPKIVNAGSLAEALQVEVFCYCSRYLTDGAIPQAFARQKAKQVLERALEQLLKNIGGSSTARRQPSDDNVVGKTSAEDRNHSPSCLSGLISSNIQGALIELGALLDPDILIQTMIENNLWEKAPNGYWVHDFLEYNPSKEKVLAGREQRKKAGEKGAERTNELRWGQRNNQRNVGGSSTARRQPSDNNAVGKTSPPTPTPTPTPDPDNKVDLINKGSTDLPGKAGIRKKQEPKKSAQKPSFRDINNAWLKKVEEVQIRKFGKAVLTPSQIFTLINEKGNNQKKMGYEDILGFGDFPTFICALEKCQADVKLEKLYGYMRAIAMNAESIEMYNRLADMVDPPETVKRLMMDDFGLPGVLQERPRA